MSGEFTKEDFCPCCGQLYGCYCHEHPHEDNPLCPGNAANIAAWVNSPEGKAALEQARQKSEAFMREYKEATKIDPESVRRPMTI